MAPSCADPSSHDQSPHSAPLLPSPQVWADTLAHSQRQARRRNSAVKPRDIWPALALVFGMGFAGAIGYLLGSNAQEPVPADVVLAAPSLVSTPVASSVATPVPPEATAPVTESALSSPTVALWRGLVLQAEHRCAAYDADDYPYAASVEAQIVALQGGAIYGPYSGRWFASTSETDIEHIVARSEAHDSGLCRASADRKRAFASDLRNLTLASPAVNRNQKRAKDAAEWLPEHNQCWFANRVVEVRRAYQLTVDQAEAAALDRVLAGCTSTEMVFSVHTALASPTPVTPAPPPTATPAPQVTAPQVLAPSGKPTGDALDLYDDNRNGRITCAEARNHGIAPVHRGHPAYEYMRDGDGDGVVCE